MTQNSVNNSASSLTVDNLFLDGNSLSTTNTNGDMIFSPDGTGEISVVASSVVPSTDRADSLGSSTNSWDNVYADGFTFDDGTNIIDAFIAASTFTPSISFGGGTTGITYSSQVGRYMRLGEVVYIYVDIILTSKGTSTGVVLIENLPIQGNTGIVTINPVALQNTVFSGAPRFVKPVGTAFQANLFDYLSATNFKTMTNADFTNTSEIRATGVYFAA